HQRGRDLALEAIAQTRRQLGFGRRFGRGLRSLRRGLLTLLLFALALIALGRLLGPFVFLGHYSLPNASPQRRQMRDFSLPSADSFTPIRTGALQRSHMIITLDTSIDASFSTIPPGLVAPRGLLWRLTILSRSTMTRPRSGITRITLPVLPRS